MLSVSVNTSDWPDEASDTSSVSPAESETASEAEVPDIAAESSGPDVVDVASSVVLYAVRSAVLSDTAPGIFGLNAVASRSGGLSASWIAVTTNMYTHLANC